MYGSAALDPGVEIFAGGNSVFLRNVGDFGNLISLPSAMKYTQPLSVSSFDNYNFNMYPNPSYGEVNFSANENFGLKLYDLQGKKVLEDKVNRSKKLDFSHLNAGVYLAIIDINGNTKTEKLILK